MSLKWRLMLIIGALIVLLLALANVLSLRRAEHDSVREIEATSQLLLALFPTRIPPGVPGQLLLRMVKEMGLDQSLRQTRHVVVEIYARSGELVWSSHAEHGPSTVPSLVSRVSRLGDHLPHRKEIYSGEQPIGYLLVRPNPADELSEIESDSADQALLTCVVAAMLLMAVYWTMNMALGPLAAVRRGLAELQAGNLGTRMPRFSLPEMDELASSFNHTAMALENAVAQRQRLTQKLVGMEEDTRCSVARDLHDELGSYLVAMQPHVRLIADACDKHEQLHHYRDSAQSLIEHLAHLLQMVRHLLERLRPPEIEALGLRNALQGLIDHWRRHAPRSVVIDFVSGGDLTRGSPTLDVSIYRIVQECLTNAFKHSDAEKIDVSVEFRDEVAGRLIVDICVTDNGSSHRRVGGGGLGVLGMRERVEALGGQLTAESLDGAGWQVMARLFADDSLRSLEPNG
jgi:two-component system, NarL family, sensor histidine kinase UhpB